MKHPALSPRRIACCGQGPMKQPHEGRPALRHATKMYRAWRSEARTETSCDVNPCSEFVARVHGLWASSSKMQPRPVGIEAIGRNLQGMDCVHALLPCLQVSRRDGDALQPDARRDCVPSSPARADAVIDQAPPA
jgi:hypothetical protein